MAEEWQRADGYIISTDRQRLDLDVIHAFVTRSYWFEGIRRDVMERAVAGSLPFGLYAPDGRQVGFCRVVSDFATFAYLMDVFVLEEHRGRKLGVWLIETVVSHPKLQGLRLFRLATKDAHGLYERFGFRPIAQPERMMEIVDNGAGRARPA
jgi:GNAT superfamily N-acetyltransferase